MDAEEQFKLQREDGENEREREKETEGRRLHRDRQQDYGLMSRSLNAVD